MMVVAGSKKTKSESLRKHISKFCLSKIRQEFSFKRFVQPIHRIRRFTLLKGLDGDISNHVGKLCHASRQFLWRVDGFSTMLQGVLNTRYFILCPYLILYPSC